MSAKKLKFLFIQPDFPKHYVTMLPVYEPMHGLLFASIIKDLASSRMFDRRYSTDEKLAELLLEYKPDIVGITIHSAGEIDNIKRILGVVKKCRGKCVTIVGGQHATLLPEDLYDPAVDLVCIGPGEETFREVAEALADDSDFSKISGLAIKSGKEYTLTPPRIIKSGYFSWPSFDRSLLSKEDTKHYYNHFEGRAAVYTITTSGCPHRCSFCSLWATQRGTYRHRLPEEVVEDIKGQPQQFVHITDDNTFFNEDYATELYERMKKAGIRKKILAYARVDTVIQKPHVIEKWKEIGLGALVVGLEAVSDEHLKQLNKRSTVGLNKDALRVLNRLGIEAWGHFVLMPHFEKTDFEQVSSFVEEMNMPYPIFVPMTPIPGTPLFFEEKAKGNITTFDYGYYHLQYMVCKTKLPKREWYKHYQNLYLKSASPLTLARRSLNRSFHFMPAFGRAYFMSQAMRKLNPHIEMQLRMEENAKYSDMEPYLPPSLRSDYVPNHYYNSTSLLQVSEKSNAAE